MKYFVTTFLALFILISCKKEKTPDLDQGPASLSERILQPGWSITEIEYSGFAPNPLDTTKIVPFSGQGTNVSGYFVFQENPNEGEFEINFTSNIDIGLSNPISFPVKENHRGNYNVWEDESHVSMWRNDTVFDWAVVNNEVKKQTWSTTISYKFQLTATSSVTVPISVKATMVR